jgi:REP element-mobilizing transposase RayT
LAFPSVIPGININPRCRAKATALCFATLCSNQRAPFASDPAVAEWLISILRECALKKSFLVHPYCAMLDHLHFLTDGTDPAVNLVSLVRSFKQNTGLLLPQVLGLPWGKEVSGTTISSATMNPLKQFAGTSG